ncbi:uncharacterized protein LOC127532379 [Acanthochromis polyacanthus]|uniref:uncharacterized protein LOC127532379 n=1 Tax=Acanthochromis polyacanthus TaxID=80966 RepID=UPI00223405E6|nr:uncharacterized protein LOC127532379 [Acanthochromis polyacanthus]
MKLLLSSMLLASLCTLSSWSVSLDALVVIQSPDVSVMEGEAVNITCCWTENTERVWVQWLKNGTTVQKQMWWQNKSQGSLKKDTNDCSSLTFPNITRNDSGRYICRVFVEIPLQVERNGTGTLVTVNDLESTDYNYNGGDASNLKTPVIVAVAVVVPLFLITVACFCNLRRKRAQAARVIYEVPHVDSEEAEMDKHSTSSSRGSSQWCQVPVYESVEYFQHAETKGEE